MKSRAVQITRFFFYLLAALWLAVGVNYIIHGWQVFAWVIPGMMFVNIPVFILLGTNLTKRPVYWLAVIVLFVCILLTIFDYYFGFADLAALILFIIPLVIMLVKRNEFFQETQ